MTEFRHSNPVFLVADIAATIIWYRDKLGFTSGTFPEKPPHAFAVMSKDSVEIMLQQLDDYVKPDLYQRRNGGVWDAYLRVDGVHECFERISIMPDVAIVEPLKEQWYGDTEFVIRDLNGYILVISQ